MTMTTAKRLLGRLHRLLLYGKGKGLCICWLTIWIGGKKCRDFFREIPKLRRILRADLKAAYEGDPAAESLEEIRLCYPGFYAVMTYRLAHELYQLNVPLLPRILAELAHSCTGVDIHPGAVIGEGFFIDHGTGVVIGQTAVVGRNVKLYQGVTLGGLSTRGGQRLRQNKRHPTLGDGVTVYANATILGGDTEIGDGCTIGANAFITSSIPAGTRITAQCR